MRLAFPSLGSLLYPFLDERKSIKFKFYFSGTLMVKCRLNLRDNKRIFKQGLFFCNPTENAMTEEMFKEVVSLKSKEKMAEKPNKIQMDFYSSFH